MKARKRDRKRPGWGEAVSAREVEQGSSEEVTYEWRPEPRPSLEAKLRGCRGRARKGPEAGPRRAGGGAPHPPQ